MRPEGIGSIDVWHFRLDVEPRVVRRAALLLDAHERGRAGRFRDPLDARRYTVAHGAIREVLGGYLGVPSRSLRWTSGPHGKPGFTGRQSRWQWSMSRSAGHALLAVCLTDPVGVDIERIRDDTPAVALAIRYLPEDEAESVATQANPGASYHTLLARKEACVKASGGRFLDGLRVRVLVPGTIRGAGPLCGHRWELRDLPAPPGFVAALATTGDAIGKLRFFEWRPQCIARAEAAAVLPGLLPRGRPANGYGAIQLVPGE